MIKKAITGIAKKIKLPDNKMIIVITKTAIGTYDEEQGIFIDSKGKIYKDPESNTIDCFMNLTLIEELEKYGTTPEKFSEQIKNMFYYVVIKDGIPNFMPFDRANLEQSLDAATEAPQEDIFSMLINASETYDKILDGYYDREELYMLQAQFQVLNSNLTELLGAINEQIGEESYAPKFLS